MPYTAYDLDDLLRLMEDRWDGTPFWDPVEGQAALNEALREWNTLTGYWKYRDTLQTIINVGTYELPSTIVFGFRVECNNRPLTPSSLVDLDDGRPRWQEDIGTPRMWAPIDLNTIILWPTPAVGGVELIIDGIAATPVLLNDNEAIQIGSDALDAIVGYALHAVALKEGGERWNATMKYFENFLTAAGELNNQLEKSEMFRHFLGLDRKQEERPTR